MVALWGLMLWLKGSRATSLYEYVNFLYFVFLQFSIFYMGGVALLYVSFCVCGIFYLIITSVKLN